MRGDGFELLGERLLVSVNVLADGFHRVDLIAEIAELPNRFGVFLDLIEHHLEL